MDNKIILNDREIPKTWYNILPELMDLKTPFSPPLHPGRKDPITPEDLAPLFPMGLIEQEVSQEKEIPIPEECLDILSLWRPTPLYRARQLEKTLKTPAKIYYKNESVSPPGSHKPNTAVPQAFYNMKEGIKRLTTETGAGQWGSALSFACNYFDIEAMIYMVRISFDQKPFRKLLMHTWGGKCVPSPSELTEAGRAILKTDPNCPGSLGLAISEAVEDAVMREDTHYTLGSVLNHVLLHQTIIGKETMKQMEIAEDKPDIMIGCVGGGSNFGGLILPFIPAVKAGEKIQMIGVEPSACPTLSRGKYAYDFGDMAGMTPLLKMYTLGHKFMPPKIHAGGLRYHGDSPIISQLCEEGIVEPRTYHQKEVFDAAVTFARSEGFVPAPETAHAIKATIDEAEKCRESGKSKVIVFGYSGHGHFDLNSYEKYFEGELVDYSLSQQEIDAAENDIPQI